MHAIRILRGNQFWRQVQLQHTEFTIRISISSSVFEYSKTFSLFSFEKLEITFDIHMASIHIYTGCSHLGDGCLYCSHVKYRFISEYPIFILSYLYFSFDFTTVQMLMRWNLSGLYSDSVISRSTKIRRVERTMP